VPPLLLVSVIAPDEVDAALEGGADIVDVKNPAEGSLGAPTPAVVAAVRARVPAEIPLSVALGDAPLPGTMALAAAGAVASGAGYVKLGLRGLARAEDAVALLAAVRAAAQGVHPHARVVAVAYADGDRANGLRPPDLPAVAASAGVHGVMIDTARKDGVSSFDALGEQAIVAFVATAQALGLMTALAGALSALDVARSAALGVDVVGVRGAACVGGRAGRVAAAKVRGLREAVRLGAAAFPALVRS
jgi:(5-formylfuran-3-yl)methyl phosphate synthase